MAGAARALRCARAQSGGARRRRRGALPLARRSRSSISPAAPARRCARSRRVCRRGRTGGWSTTTSACWRARRRRRARRRHGHDGRRSISPAISKPRSTGRSIWSPPRRCSISSRRAWLERLAVEIAARRLPLYAALSYDGRVELDPADPFDAAIDCRGERASAPRQGFWARARPGRRRRLRSRDLKRSAIPSCTVESDWVIGPDDREIQMEMLGGLGRRGARNRRSVARRHRSAWLTRRRDARRGRALVNPRRSRRRLSRGRSRTR